MREAKAVDDNRYIKTNGAYRKKPCVPISNILRDFGCQYNCKKERFVCTCKKIKNTDTGYFASRQVYRSQRYFNTGDFTAYIGEGSGKTVYKKRVKRIYLPDTEDKGVGSSDLSHLHRRRHWSDRCCQLSTVSSKCIGSTMNGSKVTVSKKLSPIIDTISGSTSPIIIVTERMDKSCSYDNTKHEENNVPVSRILQVDKNVVLPKIDKSKSTTLHPYGDSSDSFEEHVHDLESPSSDKEQSKILLDVIENKIEREYRKIFSTKSKNCSPPGKPIAVQKSSLLKRRFMALRRLGKKENKNNLIKQEITINDSIMNKRDVSITSDPPSLEARSYSNTKLYSPSQSVQNIKEKESPKTTNNWSADIVDSDCQDVHDMFKLWGQKFNLEGDTDKNIDFDDGKKQKKKVELVLPKDEPLQKEKKEVKLFSLFKRKGKDKSKPFKPKKSITAGRCEVGDGLTIKIGAANDVNTNKHSKVKMAPEYDILTKGWFNRYIQDRIDSHNSVKIRWHNNMYTASSSTVFELMDCIYKNTSFLFTSRSQTSTSRSSYYTPKSTDVNFMQQNIQAWMVPTIVGGQMPPERKSTIEVTISNQRWLIDKSKTFSRKIELVLHSDVQNKSIRSEYIIIDIPKGYFSETSSDDKTDQTSDELVYNVVEYEMSNSKENSHDDQAQEYGLETGDARDLCKPVDTNDGDNKESKIIKSAPLFRDVLIQGSDICFPRRYDVIGVGIITQQDLLKPILKIHDRTDDESRHILAPLKTCELAESFLQEYYKNCTPLGIDIIAVDTPRCNSDSKLCASSEASIKSFNNQGDGSRSCPNIYDDYLAHSTIVSSCETSSCSHCAAVEEEIKQDKKTLNFFNKFKKSVEPPTSAAKRVLPKDSLEVHKRRKLYAASNKSKWFTDSDRCDVNDPSFHDRSAQQSLGDCPKISQSLEKKCFLDQSVNPKKCKKHVSLQSCHELHEELIDQLEDKIVEGILAYKGASGCDECKTPPSPRRARVNPDPICQIPKPPCMESCEKKRRPACSKKNSPTCNVPKPPSCPVGPKPPCEIPCPPTTPPCQAVPCDQSSNTRSNDVPKSCLGPLPPQSCPPPPPSRKPPCDQSLKKTSSHTLKQCTKPSPPQCKHPKSRPIPPKIHSPAISPKVSHNCVCSKRSSVSKLSKTSLDSNVSNCPSPQKKINPIPSPPSNSCRYCNSKCSSPPSKVEKVCSQEFPWPLKSQVSNCPSKESVISFKTAPNKKLLQKTSSKCLNAIKRIMEKCSNSSIKECKPDCANRRKLKPNPPPQCNKSQPKVTGLHLRKQPMPKSSSKGCLDECGVIRLNSTEKVTIKFRQTSPSTEEIREGCNIKVKDEDGQTLYERKDYRKKDHRMNFVKDMYRESQIHRLATTNSDVIRSNNDLKESTSSTSYSNIIEINLNLKFKKGDKSLEGQTQHCGETLINKQYDSPRNEASKEVYLVNNQEKDSNQVNEVADKKDVNINILIKHYKNPNKLTNTHSVNLVTEEFSKKISEKFQSVSTGYSDVTDKQTISVHRATVNKTNLDASEMCKSSIELLNEEIKEPISKTVDSDKSIFVPISNKTSSNIENLLITDTESQIKLSKDALTTNDEKSVTSISTIHKKCHSTKYINTDRTVPKIHDKEEKKNMLEKIFELTNNKPKSKQQIRQMLRAVLSSDSSAFDIETKNCIAKEITYESLKPNYFKDCDSVDNYLNKPPSSQSMTQELKKVKYPTETNSGVTDETDLARCMCSRLAEKLKLTNDNTKFCCCSQKNTTDRQVDCNLIEDNIKRSKNDKCASFNIEHPKEDIKSNTLTSYVSVKACQINKLSTRTLLSVSDDDQIDLHSSQNLSSKSKPIDILQLYETKKAVLEIYAEKRVSEKGEKIVAKLPKFVYERENEIQIYQETVASCDKYR